MCHKSQIGDPEARHAADPRLGAGAGRAAGLPEGSAAELFRVTRIP